MVLDNIEFYDENNNQICHLGRAGPAITTHTKKVLLYFEGKSIVFTMYGQEICLCQLDFHFLYNN